jgi:asparagine synthase (glutamine-hydrolysing)
MCGITGIFNFDKQKPVDLPLLEYLSSSIKHRGPDANGKFVKDNIGLAHRRLSIIDLTNGSQPMNDIQNQINIVFNGEIYNYKDLRDELEKLGYKFRTESDTEVIIYSFKHWGVNCFGRLNGEWAIAIWDEKTKKLTVCRDRYGIKPLYFSYDENQFLFSSEIKSFYELPTISVDKYMMWDQLVFGPIDGGKTFLKNVEVLMPGHYLEIDVKGVNQGEYYRLEDSLRESSFTPDYDEIDYLLADSVERRLMSDVKLATINSGGLDSSLISSIAKQKLSGKLYTFSTAPEMENGLKLHGDESEYADFLGEFIGSNHNTIRYSRDSFIDEIEAAVYFNDSLLYHSNSIPLSRMFNSIKNDFGVTVALGGEGADEVFRGYSVNVFSGLARKSRIYYLDKAFSQLLKYKYPKISLVAELIPDISIFASLSVAQNMFLNPNVADKLLGIKGHISEDRLLLIERMKQLPLENQTIYYEQKCYLYGLLQRADRMAMRWGLETRVPFLDHRLVNKLNGIHPIKKSGLTDRNLKKILKSIGKKYVPESIVSRKKFGFASPLAAYSNNILTQIDKSIIEDIPHNKLSPQDVFIIYNYQNLISYNNEL